MSDAPLGMQVQRVETGRLRMSYRTSGDPDGMPLLLLHGGFASSRWWEPLAASLPSEFHLIAPDLRGCGGSEQTRDGYDIASQADDLASFAAALDLPACPIVGHAAGAAIALEYACVGGPVSSLILISPPALTGVPTPPEAIATFARMREDESLLRAAMTLLAPFCASQLPAFFDMLVRDAASMAEPAFVAVAQALASWDRQQDARTLTLPVLVVWGDQDIIVDRASVMRTLVSLPGAENLDLLHGIGHAPMLDDPLGLAESIVAFVTADTEGYAAIREQGLAAPQDSPQDSPQSAIRDPLPDTPQGSLLVSPPLSPKNG